VPYFLSLTKASAVVELSAVYTNEFKNWEFGHDGAAGLKQQSGAEAAQLE